MGGEKEKGIVGSFEVLDEDVLGRVGRLETAHGAIRTPALLPVVDPGRNVLEASEILSIGFDAVITNAYLVKRHYGDVALELGVHGVLGVECPVMTDSGAYQLLVYGRVDVEPDEIVRFQVSLGSDIGVVLDIPTRMGAPRGVVKEEVEETLRRVRKALEMDLGSMILVGPVQGGLHLDLVARSAAELSKTSVPMFAVGGPTQLLEEYRFADLVRLVMTAKMNLDPSRPLHLFGAGHPMLIPLLVAMGVDTFDSASYALYARDGRYMTPMGTYRIEELEVLPCECPVCRGTDASDLKEMPREEREEALARHNLYVLKREIDLARQAVSEGTLWNLLESRARCHPALYGALRELRKYVHFIEKRHPVTHVSVSAEMFYDRESRYRPSVYRHMLRLAYRYEPPHGRVAVLIPAWPSRPVLRFGWAASLLELLPEDARSRIHVLALSPAYGVVPAELEELYPLSQYELPPDPLDMLEDSVNDVCWFFRRYRTHYVGLVVVLYDRYARIARKVATELEREGLPVAIVKIPERPHETLGEVARALERSIKSLLVREA